MIKNEQDYRTHASAARHDGEHGNGEHTICEKLQALKEQVIELFYDQTSAPEEFASEDEVCRLFSRVLHNYWHLCSLTTFLVGDDGELRACAIHEDEHAGDGRARSAATRLARRVQQTERECEVWLDAPEARAAPEQSQRAGSEDEADTCGVESHIEEAAMRAACGVPIHARHRLIGVLVALTNSPADMREARHGLRFIATPIVIALSNARRSSALREQRTHIDRLYQELQQRAGALEEANRELLRIARYRSLFLSRMSHELRTPLTSILGFAEILLDHEDLTAAQRRFCEKIQSSGLQQQESLNALVDLSRLEAGRTELFLHEFSLREMLRESCAAVARLARKANVTLDRSVDVEPATIVSDEGKLRQALYNFLAFAIHRTPSGGRVQVTASAAETNAEQSDQPTTPRFHIEITDEGEPLADPAHIFEPFDEGHAPGAMPNERGTDMNELGLVIAHRLIGALNGTIELSFVEDQGLRVRLTFPLLPPPPTALE